MMEEVLNNEKDSLTACDLTGLIKWKQMNYVFLVLLNAK